MFTFFSDFTFYCKSHAHAYAKKFIAEQIPFHTIIELSSTNGKFLTKLLSYHPEAEYKIGCGVKHFMKRDNGTACGYTLIITRNDNTEEPFSYKACVGFKYDDFTTAMRTAVAPFLAEYKKMNPSSCALCKTFFGLQVDHKTIPFCIIKKKFLEENTLEVPQIFAKNAYNVVCFKSTDTKFETAWTDFHNKIADYQILCGDCNCKKGSKVDNKKLDKNISSLYINLNDL